MKHLRMPPMTTLNIEYGGLVNFQTRRSHTYRTKQSKYHFHRYGVFNEDTFSTKFTIKNICPQQYTCILVIVSNKTYAYQSNCELIL